MMEPNKTSRSRTATSFRTKKGSLLRYLNEVELPLWDGNLQDNKKEDRIGILHPDDGRLCPFGRIYQVREGKIVPLSDWMKMPWLKKEVEG